MYRSMLINDIPREKLFRPETNWRFFTQGSPKSDLNWAAKGQFFSNERGRLNAPRLPESDQYTKRDARVQLQIRIKHRYEIYKLHT